MRLKSYFAATVEAAVSQARQELGEDALLVNSRRTPPEAVHLGEYEVVFAAPEGRPAPPAEPAPAHTADHWERMAREVSDLRRQIERTAAAMAQSASFAGAAGHGIPELAAMATELVGADVPADLAQGIVERAANRCSPEGQAEAAARLPVSSWMDAERLRAAVADEIARSAGVDANLGRPGGGRQVVALVGPPGAGKTTTLVKLAAVYGLASRRPAQILSVDTARIAAAEQLRVYAGILGVGFQVLETTGALAQALEEYRHKDLILIDTPGISPGDVEHSPDLAAFLAAHPEMDTHLVLTAATKSADLSSAVDRFEIFRPRKLLFTRLDETRTYGSILALAARTAKPVSFLCAGQRIPEDLEAATGGRIADLLLGLRPEAALAAA